METWDIDYDGVLIECQRMEELYKKMEENLDAFKAASNDYSQKIAYDAIKTRITPIINMIKQKMEESKAIFTEKTKVIQEMSREYKLAEEDQ